MKQFIGILFLLLPLCCKAQFGSNQDAYNWGRSMRMIDDGKEKLVKEDYVGAREKFEEAYSLNNSEAAFFLGAMVELGMGYGRNCSLAQDLYKAAAAHGNANGRAALQRISQQGFWDATKENRNRFRQMLATEMQTTSIMYGNGAGTFGSGSSSSSRSCSSCGGTGRCTLCSGAGSYWEQVGTYTGTDTRKKVSCPSCTGTGRCGVCHGKGSI